MDFPSGKKYGAILIDPPWSFRVWSEDTGAARSPSAHYDTMTMEDIARLPVADLAAPDCVLFCWICWPSLPEALEVIKTWDFTYKTCGFDWVKALPHDERQQDLMEGLPPIMPKDDLGMGYWTRANTEPCLLATRGKPKRKDAGVRMLIMEPRRQHSRKPDSIYERIERLVPGPYIELFARQRREGWDSWGAEVNKFSGGRAAE